MRDQVRAFVAAAAAAFELRGPVYEFGSLQVPGQEGFADLRGTFSHLPYIGCDMRTGPGVDRLEDLAELTLDDEVAGTVICVDTLEHVFEARRGVQEMIRILAPGGMLLLAAPLDFRIHAFPDDYWRITPGCMQRLLGGLDASLVGSQGVESFPHTVFGLGMKAPVPADFSPRLGYLIQLLEQSVRRAAECRPWSRRARERVASLFRSKGERRRMNQMYDVRFAMNFTGAASPADVLGAPHFLLPRHNNGVSSDTPPSS
jgi:SAM-dependent methyltransferase